MVLVITLNPCIDKTVFVSRNRLGKIIRAQRVKIIAGGKGNNVSRVLNSLNIDNISLNVLGDYYGKVIEKKLLEDSINYEAFWVENPSRTVVTILEKNLRQTAFVEPGPSITNKEIEKILKFYEEILNKNKSKIKFVIFSGSIPNDNCVNIYKEMIEIAKNKGIKALLDSRGKALENGVKAKPYLIKPNLYEFAEIAGISSEKNIFKDEDTICDYLLDFHKYSEIVILTMGEKGSLLSYKNEIYKAIPSKIEIINPIGSGDSFIAGFTYGLINKLSIEESLKIATSAGVANASMWDAAYCNKEQIMENLEKIKVVKIRQ